MAAFDPGAFDAGAFDAGPTAESGFASTNIVFSLGPTGSASVQAKVSVVPSEILSGSQSVARGLAGMAAQWIPLVYIDGASVDAQVVGDIRIDAEEGAARIAEITLRPTQGTLVDLPGWTGKSVIVDIADNSTGAPLYPMRLFSGVIDTPALSLSERTITIRCTDDLQGRCAGMSNSELIGVIGGYGSHVVFDEASSGWSLAQDLLSTVPASLDISPDGALRLTPWAPKASPDLVFDDSQVGENSLSVEIANRSSLVNDVEVEFDYRFPRVKAEGYVVSHEVVNLMNFATHVLNEDYFLQRAQVEAAIASSGGNLVSINYTALPDYIIPVGTGFWSPGPNDSTLCMGFTALVSFDYAQTSTEQHRISVRNQASIDAIGLRSETISSALEGGYTDISAAESSIRLYKAEISGIPPQDVATVTPEKTTSSDVTLSPETNRAAADEAMEALIAIGKTRIWSSHRGNSVSAAVPLNAAIDVDKTIYIVADGVTAKGKCSRVTHNLSTDSGLAISEFSVAICSVSGVGFIHAEDPTVAPTGTSAGQTDISVFPTVVFNKGLAEDHNITITFPGVEDAERNAATVEIATEVSAVLFEDIFNVTI